MEDNKKHILGSFKELDFDEAKHQYYVNGNPIKISVSGLIKRFVKPVDFALIARNKDRSGGLEKGTTQKMWDDKKDRACKKGTDVHLFGELYPFNKHLKPRNKYEDAVVKFWDDLPEHIIPIVMEIQMYHKEYMFAGTADILLYNTQTDSYIIGDYKTNKDLFKNFIGKKLLAPFNNLLDCPYSKYQLQLSYYQILFEQLGFKVSSRKIIWLLPTGEYEMYDTDNYTEELKEHLKYNGI